MNEQDINTGWFYELECLGYIEPIDDISTGNELFDILKYGTLRGWQVTDPDSKFNGLILWAGSCESDSWQYCGPESLRHEAMSWLWQAAVNGGD